MTQIIETRMMWDIKDKKIYDHQSRVVEAESWDFYKDAIKNYNGKKIEFKSVDVPGATILSYQDIYDFKSDDYHLSYRIPYGDGSDTLCFAYKRNLEGCE